MNIRLSKRMEGLPPYLFAEINRLKADMALKGVDVIDLGIGDPDEPTPDLIVKSMQEEVAKPQNQNYPPYDGIDEFRKQIAVFFKQRFGADLDPGKEILPLIGSKEGIFHLPFVMLDQGDYSLVPDPGYPVYSIATGLIGGEVFNMPLLKSNDFLPDLGAIPSQIAKKAKILFINYPNNPTSAVADDNFFAEVAQFARENEIIVAHDMAYSEVYFSDKGPQSILATKAGKEVSIEFHSLSKTFNMTGWRVGFAAGSEKIVGALARLKTNIDSGIFKAVQRASVKALKNWRALTATNRELVKRRAAFVAGTLREMGYEFRDPQATFYFWVEVPGSLKSREFSKLLLERTGVVVTPGIGMGPSGDGYFRISLTCPDERLKEAMERLKRLDIKEIG